MGGIAALARAAGHRVTGSDQNVYPPMSDQLAALGIELIEGYDPEQLELKPDVVVVGNVMSRGNALIEALLESGIPYTSGPEWLARHVLAGRWTLAVAGTHGKTTTSSILAWILEYAGLDPGFLIGGVPGNFDVTARLGARPAFRRRGRRIRHGVLRQARQVRALPAAHRGAQQSRARPRRHLSGRRLDPMAVPPAAAHGAAQWPGGRQRRRCERHARASTWAAGRRCERFAGGGQRRHRLVRGRAAPAATIRTFADHGRQSHRRRSATGRWSVVTTPRMRWRRCSPHVTPACDAETAIAALKEFKGVRRRMEVRGVVNGVTVYDDFAHHPTAVATTIDGLRRRIGAARLIAVLEPRSNTMKLGTHRDALAGSLAQADRVWMYQGPSVHWDVAGSVATLGERAGRGDGHRSARRRTLATIADGRRPRADHVERRLRRHSRKLLERLRRKTSEQRSGGRNARHDLPLFPLSTVLFPRRPAALAHLRAALRRHDRAAACARTPASASRSSSRGARPAGPRARRDVGNARAHRRLRAAQMTACSASRRAASSASASSRCSAERRPERRRRRVAGRRAAAPSSRGARHSGGVAAARVRAGRRGVRRRHAALRGRELGRHAAGGDSCRCRRRSGRSAWR